MIVASITELILYPVMDRGVPNLERVPILIREKTDMGRYGVMFGPNTGGAFALPLNDNLYWFGDGLLNPGDWILLYTGGGDAMVDDWKNPPGSKVYTLHWGKGKTIFADSSTVPILFRADAVLVGIPQEDVPQSVGLLKGEHS